MPKKEYGLKKQPLQERSKYTVEVIKEAAAHILRDEGCKHFTTNRVAEKAGVSIGSLYQYFPSKESLIAEVKRDHFSTLREMFRQAYNSSSDHSLPGITRVLIAASIEAHVSDPELHHVLSGDLSEFEVKENDHSQNSISSFLEDVLVKHKHELRDNINIPLASHLIYTVVETVIHDTVIHRPHLLKDDAIKKELFKLVMAYLGQTE